MANPTNMATQPDSAQTYLDSLKKQLADAKLELDTALAAQNALQVEYDKTLAWQTQICDCLAALEATNASASALIAAIGAAGTQANIVGQSATFASNAFLHMLSDLQEVAKCIEALKCLIPTGNKTPGNIVADACDKLAAALAEAMKCAETVLKGMLEVYKKGQKLQKGIADPGLHKSICLVSDYFTKPGPKPDHSVCASCSDAEKPVFPLDEKQPGFLQDVAAACGQAETDVAKLLTDLQAAQTEKNKKQTCYDALKAACEAAAAAKACKK